MATLIFIYNVRMRKPSWNLWFTVGVQICSSQIAISLGSTPDGMLERNSKTLQCAVLDFTTGAEFRPSLPRAQGPEDEGSGNLGGAILGSYILTGSI